MSSIHTYTITLGNVVIFPYTDHPCETTLATFPLS
jgi:hypothetical protein